MHDYFYERNLSNKDKVIIAKQKLSGAAKQLINSLRPDSFDELETHLYSSFGQITCSYETLASEMKSSKLKSNETFQNFYLRMKDIAHVLALKLNCSLSNLSVFEPFSKAILSKFPDYISSQQEIINACKNCDSNNLFTLLTDIIQHNPLMWNNSNNNCDNRPKTETNPFKMVSNVICANCYKPGHVVKNCRAPKFNNHQFFR